jgi:methionyl-tRNA formyltransferase
MRVLFWGTPLFSIPSLDILHESDEHEVISVVSQPDKPRGRGQKTSASPVKERSLEFSIPVIQPGSTKDESFLEHIRSLEPDINAVVAYGKILHKQALEIPGFGSVCLHPSLLPEYRGAAPIQRAIMDGITETGVTIFQMDEGMDTGPVILQRSVSMGDEDNLDTLSYKLSIVCAEVLLEGLSLMSRGEAIIIPQSDGATLARKVSKEEAKINWGDAAQAIERLIRALSSKPGAYTTVGGQTLKIYRAAALPEEHTAESGTVVKVLSDAIVVATGRGWLSLSELQLEGKKRMDAASFLRGKRMEIGTQLG